MTLIQALLMGIVQGLTEFIPVSSSAHLVLVPWLLGWTFEPQTAFAFNVLVQLGTLVAVIVCFWRDGVSLLWAAIGALRSRRWAEGRLAWLLILATLPAAAAGILLDDLVEQAFASPAASAGFLLVTATLLGLGGGFRGRMRGRTTVSRAAAQAASEAPENGARDALEELKPADSLIIGLAQALA